SGEDEPKIFSKENNFFEILEEGQKVDIVKYIDYMSAFQAGGNFLMLYKRHVRWQNNQTGTPIRFLLLTICTFLHLGDGFDACKFLINELKASVPIQKKEVYANVEIWKRILRFWKS
ncbi:hypothetical protein IGI04_023539, partial [Brassica rapa subsp. trilocularis]